MKMECQVCGMTYPPKGWNYYSIRVTAHPEFIICSDCVNHLMLIIEDDDGRIIGYESKKEG
jgi:hypothetical protein